MEVTAGESDFVELAFVQKFSTSEPMKTAEVSQSDGHHRLRAEVGRLGLRRAWVCLLFSLNSADRVVLTAEDAFDFVPHVP